VSRPKVLIVGGADISRHVTLALMHLSVTAVEARPAVWEGNALLLPESGDPFTPRPRSKGEKARNRKHRR